jgi:hypothetical protein
MITIGVEAKSWERTTHTFLRFGPGLPLGLGSPLPSTAAAPRLTPFFLGPSVGGPIAAAGGAGVPLPAGVPGLESDGVSPLAAVGFGTVDEFDEESLASLPAGESALVGEGSSGVMIFRSRSAVTVHVKTRLGLPTVAFRRSTADADFLTEGAIAKMERIEAIR